MYAIRTTRYFYGPRTVREWQTTESGNRLTFARRADAQAWARAAGSGIYYQADGEYGRPEYRVVRVQG